MTLGYNASVGVKSRDFIRAVPCTVLTTNTAGVIVPDYAVVKFDVRLRRTAFKTLGVYTVVTAHRVKKLQCVREFSHLHLSHTPPFDIVRVGILLVTGYFTTVAAYTGSGIEMKTVLLTGFKFRNVNRVVPTLHTGIVFMIYETL